MCNIENGSNEETLATVSAEPQLRLHWITRTALALLGVVLPIICFWFAYASGTPLDAEWQDGSLKTYAALMLTGSAIGPFMPLLACSMVGLSLLIWRPTHFAKNVWVRFSIYSGVLLAAQYCAIIGAAFGESGEGAAAFFGFSLVAITILWAFGAITIWCFRAYRPKMQVTYWLVVALLFFGSTFAFPVYFILPLIFSTPWALATYTHMSVRLIYHGPGPRWRFSLARCLGVMTWLGVWFAAWRLSVMVMLEEYMQLPTQPPSRCYVATAAAKGHARFVGARIVPSAAGQPVSVNAQLRYLKAAELMLLCAMPRLHRWVRVLYDALGPYIASRLSHPLLADMAYLSLKPAEWIARSAAWPVLPKSYRRWLRCGIAIE